jgi:hypothetical protein
MTVEAIQVLKRLLKGGPSRVATWPLILKVIAIAL